MMDKTKFPPEQFDKQGRPFLGTPAATALANELANELGRNVRNELAEAREIIKQALALGDDDFWETDLEIVVQEANAFLEKYPDLASKESA